jgi:hypothetical protein
LFKRFDDIEPLINKKIDEKYRHFLATPFIEGDSITWYSKPYSETPQRLSELQVEDRTKYDQIKNETLVHYRNVVNSLRQGGKNSEAEALENATKFVNDDFVYCFDDRTVLGVWGMRLKEHVRNPIGTAAIDHAPGKNPPVEPPPKTAPPVIDEPKPDLEPEPELQKPPINPFIVSFNAGEGGNLNGISKYVKYEGDIITESEVPHVEAKEGYEFIGWDKYPNNHIVTDDTEFTAQYREVSPIVTHTSPIVWWRGCLNWLLLLLLLALIFMVIWCCLLKKCNFNFCGCGCPEDSTIVIPDPKTPPDPCDTPVAASGGDEGYIGSFEMKQKSGSFVFQYDTQSVPDKITIYEGADTKGKVIFTYSGSTRGNVDAVVEFNEPTITVEIISLGNWTYWNFIVNCPVEQNQSR